MVVCLVTCSNMLHRGSVGASLATLPMMPSHRVCFDTFRSIQHSCRQELIAPVSEKKERTRHREMALYSDCILTVRDPRDCLRTSAFRRAISEKAIYDLREKMTQICCSSSFVAGC